MAFHEIFIFRRSGRCKYDNLSIFVHAINQSKDEKSPYGNDGILCSGACFRALRGS
jgi:hypothetical protein